MDYRTENQALRELVQQATKYPRVGQTLPNGYEVLANYKNRYVLCHDKTPGASEPYATWWLDQDGDTIMGSYFADLTRAEQKFAEQCFGWFPTLPEGGKKADIIILDMITFDENSKIAQALRQGVERFGFPNNLFL